MRPQYGALSISAYGLHFIALSCNTVNSRLKNTPIYSKTGAGGVIIQSLAFSKRFEK